MQANRSNKSNKMPPSSPKRKGETSRHNSTARQEKVFEIITRESIRREQVFTGYSDFEASNWRENFEDLLNDNEG